MDASPQTELASVLAPDELLSVSVADLIMPAGSQSTPADAMVLDVADAMNVVVADNAATQSDSVIDDQSVQQDDPLNFPPIAAIPVVRVIEDVSTTVGNRYQLHATVLVNGMPTESPGVRWEQLSGPAAAQFENIADKDTHILFDIPGSYVLKLTAYNADQIGFDTLVILVNPAPVNQAPVVNVGGDLTITLGESLVISAQVSDDGLPANTLLSGWVKTSGPGNPSFGEPSAWITTVTFDGSGAYVLEFLVGDGELQARDQLQVVVLEPVPNPAPDPVPDPVPNSVPDPVPNSQGNNNQSANGNANWSIVRTGNGSKPAARHEAGALELQGKFYLLGGRGRRAVNRYDPSTNKWENLGTPAKEINHFQPVAYNGKIYIVGALNCCYPSEKVFDRIQIFNPITRKWSEGAKLPANRKRGSAGVVAYNNKIYMLGGSTNGHDGGMVNWFDEYNPATNAWKTLPNAPSKRDHFSAVVIGNKLVAAGGRQTDYPRTFNNLVAKTDVYNFASGRWENGKNIPTKRAGAMVVAFGNEAIVIGGETERGGPALTTVEAYNVKSRQWRTLKPLKQSRHSGGAAILGNTLHVVSGNTTQGGGNETQSHEQLKLK